MSGKTTGVLIAGAVSIIVAVIGQLQFFSQLLDNLGFKVADRVANISYSSPPANLCSANGDAGRVFIHTDAGNNGTFWFCVQVVEDGHQVRSRWMAVSGVPK